jgi:hypothetical protein
MTHSLKTHSHVFDKILDGSKKAEVRFDDRGFELNDILFLSDYDPIKKEYTTRLPIKVKVTHIVYLSKWIPNIDDRWKVLSFERISE